MKPLLVFGALKEYIHFFETPGMSMPMKGIRIHNPIEFDQLKTIVPQTVRPLGLVVL